MSALKRGLAGQSLRYQLTKFSLAAEEFMGELSQQSNGRAPSLSSALTAAASRFQQTYSQPLTSVMYIAGNAMAPSLNKRSLQDNGALEKLVVRSIPRPSPRSVFVGDIVALNSPLGAGPSHVMVRRVAALEGDEMVTDNNEESFEIPKDNCWVLADNPDLQPPKVLDSRTFGHIPLSNVIGRVIYAGSSARDHAPVMNNPVSVEDDKVVIDAEVDPEELFSDDN